MFFPLAIFAGYLVGIQMEQRKLLQEAKAMGLAIPVRQGVKAWLGLPEHPTTGITATQYASLESGIASAHPAAAPSSYNAADAALYNQMIAAKGSW